MSARSIFVFVEGGPDRHFFSRLCEAYLPSGGYEIASAAEIPEDVGSGKGALLRLYRFLKSKGALKDEFKGKRTYILFFLDKDVDDILGTRARSVHVVYTSCYDLENHLFVAGDVVGCVAAAAQLDHATAVAVLGGDPSIWRRSVAERWQEWLILCVCTRILNVNAPANFGRASQINTGGYGAVDPALHAGAIADLRARAATPVGRFDGAFARAERVVRRRYASNAHDTVFKGKWYLGFLRHRLFAFLRGPLRAGLNGCEDRVLSLLSYSTPVDGPWTADHRTALSEALAWVT